MKVYVVFRYYLGVYGGKDIECIFQDELEALKYAQIRDNCAVEEFNVL